MSRRKIAKRSNYKCRVCNQSLIGEEALKINLIVPNLLGGKEKYENMEMLHTSCCTQHNHLLKKYGEGKELPKIQKFFRDKNINPSSKEGISLMKLQFKKFKYANCKGK